MKFYNQIIIILYKVILIENTVDITFSQFQNLSAHLTDFECKRLVASLHYHSHQLNQAVLDAAGKIFI